VKSVVYCLVKQITYQLKSVSSKYINRNDCCSESWKSYTLILKLHIHESKWRFESWHPRVSGTVRWQVKMLRARARVCVCVCTILKCEVYAGSLTNIRTNKKQRAPLFYIPTLSCNYDFKFISNCFIHDWSVCPGPTYLENILENVFTDNAIENITFK
jgi:hypothetical protein